MAKYYIEFDTKDMKPNILAITVDLNRELVRDTDKGMPINLCDSPLYPALVRYVLANPPRLEDKGK